MNEFVEYLKEVFVHFGAIEARKMFGGYGIYHKGTMFGLVAQETLYLKANGGLIKNFEARGLRPFEYEKGNKAVKMSYYLAPDEMLDDPDEAAVWAKRSYEAAIQAKTKKKRNSSRRTK
ncbi:TfoX/Sxy family protein [Candidatus Nitrospira salsa]